MRKEIFKHLIIVTVGIMFIGCSSLAFSAVTLKLGHLGYENLHNSDEHAQAVVFKKYVEGHTNGAIEVKIHPAGVLGNMREMIEMCQMGAIQAVITYASVNTIFLPELDVVFIPYVFPRPEVAWRVLDGPFGDKLKNMMLKSTGLRALAFSDCGTFRHFTNSKHPIKSPSDLKGIKMRVPESEVLKIMVKSLGGSPTVVPWPELYTSLQTGVVDGQEVHIPSMVEIKLYEVQKYLTLDGHTYDINNFYINDRWFKKQPREWQKIIYEAGRHSNIANRGLMQVMLTENLDIMKKHGVEVYTPSAEERAEFKRLSQQPVINHMKKKFGAAFVDEFLKAVKDAEKYLDSLNK